MRERRVIDGWIVEIFLSGGGGVDEGGTQERGGGGGGGRNRKPGGRGGVSQIGRKIDESENGGMMLIFCKIDLVAEDAPRRKRKEARKQKVKRQNRRRL